MCCLVLVLMCLALSILRVEPPQLMRLVLLKYFGSVLRLHLLSISPSPSSDISSQRASPSVSSKKPPPFSVYLCIRLKPVVLHPPLLPLPSEHGRKATKKGSTPTKLNAISSGFAPSLITDSEPRPFQWQQQVLKRPLLLKWVC